MKRVLGQALSVVTVALLATAFTPACAENDQSIFIRSALAPSTNRQGGRCVYTSDPTQTGLFLGEVDIAFTNSYTAVLLIGNQLAQRGDSANTRAESNRAHINGAVVRVTDPNGGLIGEFTSLATGFVEPQLNNQASYGPIMVTAIDVPTMAKIAADVDFERPKLVAANIKVFGRTVGGVDLESGEFQFPIRVCKGCLVTFEGYDDKATDVVECKRPADDAAGSTDDLPCRSGQDERTPCLYCLETLCGL